MLLDDNVKNKAGEPLGSACQNESVEIRFFSKYSMLE